MNGYIKLWYDMALAMLRQSEGTIRSYKARRVLMSKSVWKVKKERSIATSDTTSHVKCPERRIHRDHVDCWGAH